MAYTIYKTCDTCGGDGTAELAIGGPGGGSVPCWHCGGTGSLEHCTLPALDGSVSDILDKCNDILDRCNDIFEKVSE